MKSEAVIFTGINQVEYGEIETTDPAADDVIVQTRYSWISNGTEGSFLRGERFDGLIPWDPSTMPPPYPMVPGYQKVGIVAEVGRNVSGLRPGQWVFATKTLCRNMHLGFGGHVAIGPTPVNEIYPLPVGDDPVKYAGLVLTQVGYNSGARPNIAARTHALVVGDGMVGQWAAQTLQQRGAAVALVGRHASRLSLFKLRDNDLALNSRESGWLEAAQAWAGGQFNVVVDTVGNDTNFDLNIQLLGMIARDGHYVTAGHEGQHPLMDMKLFIRREITVHCPCGWLRPRLEQTLEWVRLGRLQTLPLITDRLPAREAAQAWNKIFTKRDETLGVILEWD